MYFQKKGNIDDSEVNLVERINRIIVVCNTYKIYYSFWERW